MEIKHRIIKNSKNKIIIINNFQQPTRLKRKTSKETWLRPLTQVEVFMQTQVTKNIQIVYRCSNK